MHRIFKGARKMLREHPGLLALLAGGLLFWLWTMARREYETPLWPLTLLVLLLLGFVRIFYDYGKANAAERQESQAKLSAEADLSMRITGMVMGEKPFFSTGPYSAGAAPSIARYSVTFDNRTGAVIQTDTSYRMERRLRGKWYPVEPLAQMPEQWEALEIPAGKTEKVPIPSAPGYAGMTAGYYRMVKTVQTAKGARTVAAEFSLDDL